MKILPRYVEVTDGVVTGSLQTSAVPTAEPFYRCHCEPELGHTWHPDNIPTTEATNDAPEAPMTLEDWRALHTGDGHAITTHQMVPIGRRTDIKLGWSYVDGIFAPAAVGK